MTAAAAGRRRWQIALLILPVPLLVYLGFEVQAGIESRPATDGSCSPEAEIAHRATLLLDLDKPLDASHLSLPGDLLRRVAYALPAASELSVHALSGYAEAPRILLGRLCKTYDSGQLNVAIAKDSDGSPRDCDNLAAQLPRSVRKGAARFCGQRALVQARIDALVAVRPHRAGGGSYLVEALEEAMLDFESAALVGAPAAGSLYVFSDMLHHSEEYSHLDAAGRAWDFGEFVAARDSLAPLGGPLRGAAEGLSATIFYVARTGLTDEPEARAAHQAFWRDYFGAAELEFEDQPAMPGYAAALLAPGPTAEELAGYEREQLRHASERVRRERAELEERRLALEEQGRVLAERQLRFEEGRLGLEGERRQLAERQRSFEERVRRFEARLREEAERAAQPPGNSEPGGESASGAGELGS